MHKNPPLKRDDLSLFFSKGLVIWAYWNSYTVQKKKAQSMSIWFNMVRENMRHSACNPLANNCGMKTTLGWTCLKNFPLSNASVVANNHEELIFLSPSCVGCCFQQMFSIFFQVCRIKQDFSAKTAKVNGFARISNLTFSLQLGSCRFGDPWSIHSDIVL